MQRSRLPSMQLETSLKELRANSIEAKGAQRYGYDALVTRRVYSELDYDLLAEGEDQEWRYYRVVFTPDDITFGGAPVYFLRVKATYLDGSTVSNDLAFAERRRPEDGNQVWRLSVGAIPGAPKRIKLYFESIATGNFTIEPLH